ncbi:IS21 family transposase [Sulfoacidibacillus thermotolerans]|uniref:Integrase catalytic domain-containing protein n=1 Tax=Sulfoacidibacillus thermotolerans TaxID=1765684 RepID=A0A2U3D8G8_SULT2|nr:IS21 family transposase [Sulfoacidibacillus thermotolerans]PWI57584.1 hypothetical protein BM613_08170 [Sulfoacidibacillus thermotolerans]
MLKVPQQQYIRYLREVEGCGIQEIADRVDVNWRTAKKYADQDDWNEPITKRVGNRPILGPYVDIIDTWLLEDEQLPRKQRHTATRIYHRLQEEYQYQRGKRTVSAYVANRKQQMAIERMDRHERLEHPGGEAQADFGTTYIFKTGELVERKVLTMSFPYSNAAFAFPVPKENTECFLEALKRVFEQAGGVPHKIWFDNLSAAVVSVLDHGERELTDAFSWFCAHYRFEPQFCNPGRGNEKGNVENKVGYGRRNWCVPPPVIETPAQIIDLWEEERPKLLQLPTIPLEIYRLETARLNKYSEWQFESTLYPLPQCKARLPVLLKVKWDEIEVLSADGTYQSLATFPRPYTEKAIPMNWHAIFEGYRKRPRAVMYSTFVKLMPIAVQAFLRVDQAELRKPRILLLLRLLESYTLEEIGEGLVQVPQTDVQHPILLEHVLYAIKHPEFHPEPFAESHTPESLHGQIPQLEDYDRLLGVLMS